MASNSFTGNIILSLTLSVFIYYVFWVSILPFLLLSNEGKQSIFFAGHIFIQRLQYAANLSVPISNSFLILFWDATDNWIYGLFPPESYAFLIPAIFGIVFIGGLSAFTLYQIKGVGGTIF